MIKSPQFEKAEYANSLPRVGIAIHLDSSSQVEEVLKEWPEKVLSEGKTPHRPKGINSTTVGFVRNVDTRTKDSEIKAFLKVVIVTL